MRHTAFLTVLYFGILLASASLAGPNTDSIAYQGSLNDAANTPVPDGPKDLILSIWTDSVGGAMLHSEMVTITTVKGLFATCLGCGSSSLADIFIGQSLFLQTQLVGQSPMEPRTRLRNVSYAISASGVHSEVSSATQRAKGTIRGGGGGTNPSMFLLLEADADNDGHADYVVADSVLPDGASRVTGHDLNDDGVPEVVVLSEARSTGASIAITGDPDFDLLRLAADQDSAKIRISGQSSGDPDFDLLRIAGGTSLGTAGASITITGDPDFDLLRLSANQDSAKIRLGGRIPGDPDFDLLRLAGGSGASHLLMQSEPSGPDARSQSLDAACDNSNARLAIQSKGAGAKRLRAGQECDDAGAVSYLDCDDDGDGIPETSLHSGSYSEEAGVVLKSKFGGIFDKIKNNPILRQTERSQHYDDNGDGVPEQEITSSIVPTMSQHAINTKGTGAQSGRVVSITSGTNVDSAAFSIVHDDGASGSSAVEMASSSIDSYIHLVDDGVTVLRLSSSGSVHPISHSSGAHLTSGGTWTNASDEDLKENFRPVDGAQLLEKLGELDISQWNYKGDTGTEHIGPTAQDFQATFGVGSDGKSISTIDPAGIALAAIKELNKKNDKLAHENESLRKELEELKRQVCDIIKGK
jgi:hypothetical protein